VDEHVLAAASGLNKAVASLIAIPFHCALIHKRCPLKYGMRV
jgi:hypothetical protein